MFFCISIPFGAKLIIFFNIIQGVFAILAMTAFYLDGDENNFSFLFQTGFTMSLPPYSF